MGSKNKLKRFKQNDRFKNVIQPSRTEIIEGVFPFKGSWREHFQNSHPIVIELGCGKGEYTIELARRNPSKNFIGMDIKGARLWRGAKTALEENLTNVAFLRSQIELIDSLFGPEEVDEIWITFPDPQIKFKRTKHRLTNISFLEKYKRILKCGGVINLKTDSEFMHGYTLGLLQGLNLDIIYANHDVYKNEGSPEEVLDIQTYYENQYLDKGKPITYIKFRVQ
ncbi:tRNA (guanosine(46)-N7)-methyltransferase TrmB [Eudoraea chungangensis]|uniref:tRNA (guanosine(46)-N7)-methyltransferase TrmB n=1 Tax=Eudoraea chungangensis TaxID=1481905 RepID=UPI0023EB2D3A|nr:tRNA (guanosine(46)-N7)-methyltransferase TrmB [Eudoraea chungangensis]